MGRPTFAFSDHQLCLERRKIGEASVRDALADCREFQRLEEAGYQNELRARYGSLRRYLPAFPELPFHAEPGAERLMRGIQLLREMNQDSDRSLPEDVPIGGIVEKPDGTSECDRSATDQLLLFRPARQSVDRARQDRQDDLHPPLYSRPGVAQPRSTATQSRRVTPRLGRALPILRQSGRVPDR